MSMNVITSPYPSIAGGSIPTANQLFEYPASALTGANNDPVSSWNDSSAAARHLSQATAGAKPTTKTNQLNGFSIARFDGGDWMQFTPHTGSSNQMTFFSVLKWDGGVGVGTIYGGNSGSAQVRISNGQAQLVKATVSVLGGSATQFFSTWITLALTYDQSLVSNNLRFYVNGAADGVVTVNTDLSAANNEFIGTRNSGSENFTGDIAHLLGYNAILNSTELTGVFNALRTLYAHY